MPDLLTSAEVASLLVEKGIPITQRTLDNWRYEGKGPVFVKVLKLVRYRRADVLAWAEAQISEPYQKTSDFTQK